MNRFLWPFVTPMQPLSPRSTRARKPSLPWQSSGPDESHPQTSTSFTPSFARPRPSWIRLTWSRLLDDLSLLPQRLWRHKVVSFIRLAVGAITFTTMVLASFYGYTAWLHQRQTVSTSNVTRIEASARNLHDPGQRWTPGRIADYAYRSDVQLAYRRVEVGVRIGLKPDETAVEMVSLLGVIGAEPELRRENLSWGRCISPEGPDGIILSRSLLTQLVGNVEFPARALPAVTITVARTASGTIQSKQRELPILGVLNRDDDRVYVPLSLAMQMDRWQTHKSEHPFLEPISSPHGESRLFDRATRTYRAPSAEYVELGAPTAVLYAATSSDVPKLVRQLQLDGYDVRHQLGQQRQLMQLAVALTVLVLLVVLGSVMNAAFNSGAISWMTLSTKLREIGIKLAHGQTRTDILLAYLAEGVVVGGLASLAGIGVAIGLERPLRELLGRTLGLSSNFFSLGIVSPAMLWIFAVAATVVIGFNALGAVVPCWLALRSTPVKLLR